MIQAAPFIIPMAEALGLSIGTLGLAKVTDEVNKYIQANPEQAEKIISTIMPAQGIATIFENKKRGIGDNNPPSPIEEEKPPQQEPPKGPDIGEEILTNLATRELEKKISKEKDKSGVVVPTSLTTQNFLDDELMNKLLSIRGGIEGHLENLRGPNPKMPNSTKNFMQTELYNKLNDKYNLNSYPEGETPETVNPIRKDYLERTYNKRLSGIEYITSVAYDVIGATNDNPIKDSILIVDEDGLPVAGAKISIPGTDLNFSDVYHKDSIVITEAGSIFTKASDELFNEIIELAKKKNKRFIVAEDLTTPEALEAMEKRGYKKPTTKDIKKFKGKKIRRPNGRKAVQKNLVLDLGAPEKKAMGGMIDSPLPGGSRFI